MRNHEASFAELKSYYNDITKENLNLIKSQKVINIGILSFNILYIARNREYSIDFKFKFEADCKIKS